MLEEFGPERVRNTPISEMAIVGAGIGAAITGMRPIVEIMYQDFTTLAMEQLVNQAAKHRYMSGGAGQGAADGSHSGRRRLAPGAQHAQQLEAWFVHVPGLKVVFPSTPEDVARTPLRARSTTTTRSSSSSTAPLRPQGRGARTRSSRSRSGRPRIHREGEDVTRRCYRAARPRALKAATQAEQDGISVEVFDPRTLQPLDEDALIASVKKTNRSVVAHEAVTRMGWGAEVAAVVQEKAFDYLDAPVARVGAKFTPIPFAPVMEEWVVPHSQDVLAAIKKTVGKE